MWSVAYWRLIDSEHSIMKCSISPGLRVWHELSASLFCEANMHAVRALACHSRAVTQSIRIAERTVDTDFPFCEVLVVIGSVELEAWV